MAIFSTSSKYHDLHHALSLSDVLFFQMPRKDKQKLISFPNVSSTSSDQHPTLDGRMDGVLFGRSEN